MAELAAGVGVRRLDLGDIRRPLGIANRRQQPVTRAEQPGGILELSCATKGDRHAEQALGRATMVALVGEDLQRLEETVCGLALIVEVMGDIAEVVEDTRDTGGNSVLAQQREATRVQLRGAAVVRLRAGYVAQCIECLGGKPGVPELFPQLQTLLQAQVGD